jgi:hypothetical protein
MDEQNGRTFGAGGDVVELRALEGNAMVGDVWNRCAERCDLHDLTLISAT